MKELYFDRLISSNNKSHQWPQIFAIFVASLSALMCGSLFAWPSPSVPILISNDSHLDPMSLEETSYFPVIPPISGAIAAPIMGYLMDIIGRKLLLMSIAVPYISSWLLIAFSKNVFIFYLSRLLCGIGDAILFTALPTYIGEIAEPSVRGAWGNVLAVNIYLGQLLINIVGAYCTIQTTALIFVTIPIIFAGLMLLLPETPYFLLMKGKENEAEMSLQKLRWQKNVKNELETLIKDVQRQISESGSFKELITISVNRKALLLSLAIRAAQQMSGFSAFAVYTQYIFNQAKGGISASTSSIIYTAMLVISITIFAFVVDKFGRRKLMTFSSFVCAIVLGIVAVYFYVDLETTIDTSSFSWTPLAGMLIYIVAFSSGLGIIPTLMLSELFSVSIKSKALCVLQVIFCIYVLVISKLFQVLSYNFGMYIPFAMFSISCFLSTAFSYFCVPETKGKTLEEIQQNFKKKIGSK